MRLSSKTRVMQLVLGTVQFGLAYGVAGRGVPVPEPEVRQILARAWELGVRTLDTAAAYGDIELRLPALMGDLPFKVVTKVAPCPADTPADAVVSSTLNMLQRAHERLGERMSALMFHSADDLLLPGATGLWSRCAEWSERHGILLGVSCYDPATLDRLLERMPIRIAQLPGSALDQRLGLSSTDQWSSTQLHLRSAFLQGLLLMPLDGAIQRVPAAAEALRRWHVWLRDHQLAPLEAALAVVKSFARGTHCVVGVNNVSQMEEIAVAWHATSAIKAQELSSEDLQVIDPRRWPVAS
jgi:aryl-alcohol dehydrogenase-like predicted oxidoreductase